VIHLVAASAGSRRTDPRHEPAIEPAGFSALLLLDALRVALELSVESFDVDARVRRTEILERHQRLDEEVPRAAAAAALESQVKGRRHLDERAEKLLLGLLGRAPELLPDFVALEVRPPVEELDTALERFAQSSSAFWKAGRPSSLST
jgi:hypothetical protein